MQLFNDVPKAGEGEAALALHCKLNLAERVLHELELICDVDAIPEAIESGVATAAGA